MKKATLILFCLTLAAIFTAAQPGKKPAPKPTNQPDMNKLLEEAMKNEGMSKEEMEQMKKMMKDVMPALNEVNAKTADYPEFSSNKGLIPVKNPAKIGAMSRKALSKTEVAGYANGLYAKIMAKGDPAEIAIVKKVVSMTPTAAAIGSATVLAMLQGHPQAALALSIKAVATDPGDLNWQNNMSALLTNYGYPEQAMPLLKKLKNELPGNSTILNNIGYAWLAAGETDSARRYFSSSLRSNPAHHESKCGNGLIEEVKGDPVKAGKTFEEAMELSVNPFIDQVLKNNKGKKGMENLDFEKIKRNLSIYEYFKKDWIKEPPVLHNNVKYYNEDLGMIKGYQDMTSELGDRIEEMTKTLGAELDELSKKGEEEFVKEMAAASMKGLSFMSKPAVVVLGVLSTYTAKWHLDYTDTLNKITEWKYQLNVKRQKEIDAIYKQISDQRGTTCEQFKGSLDKIENDYMKIVNTRLRELLVQKVEEYRQWLNAWCTWSWYVTGNTKNIILMQDINFTQYLTEMYSLIVTSMEVKGEHCSPPVYEVKEKIEAPPIPNFACPAVVSIPSGEEWNELVADSKDFDINQYQIKKTDKPVPNLSVAYGSKGQVAQPGKVPFVKTANGSISPGMFNDQGDGLKTPVDASNIKDLAKQYTNDAIRNKGVAESSIEADQDEAAAYIRKEFNQLVQEFLKTDMSAAKRERMDKLAELLMLYNELVAERSSTRAKNLLSKLLSADCDQKKKPQDRINEEIKRRAEENHQKAKDLIKQSDADEKEFEASQKEAAEFLTKKFTELIDKFIKGDITPEESERMEKIGDVLEEYKQDYKEKFGVYPTISSGAQAPGTFTPDKTLFQ